MTIGKYQPKKRTPRYKYKVYAAGEVTLTGYSWHIDIVGSHSIFYDETGLKSYRYCESVRSINICAGIITVYYENNSFIEIIKLYEK